MRLLSLTMAALVATACQPSAEQSSPETAHASGSSGRAPDGATRGASDVAAAPATIETRSREALAALKSRDGAALAALVHPGKGLRFSLYGHVFTDRDVVIPRDSVTRLFADTTHRLWGEEDGSGAPIRLTFADYYKRFVYDVDFASAPQQRADSTPIRPGNSLFNLREAYPRGRWIELHFPGFDPKYEGMDWRSLWLVFEPVGGDWKLVGLVHGRWTI